MNSKQYMSDRGKRSPKTFAAVDKRWDIKMIGPVTDFIFHIQEHINPKAQNAVEGNEYLYDGPEIESEVWKLLEKVRRITKLEKV
jgi:hypothetical protein